MIEKSILRTLSLLMLVFLSIVLTGCDLLFPPDPTSPILTTTDVSSVTASTALSGRNVTDDGDETVTNRGVCWNTAPAPAITNSKTAYGIGTDLEMKSNIQRYQIIISYLIQI